MIFPDWSGTAAQSTAKELPLYTDWAVDWNTGTFAVRNGAFYTVSGDEALRIWVYRALRPENVRFLYSAYSADYGNQLQDYLCTAANQEILESLLEKEIRETLLVSPYITAVDGFSFRREGSCMTAKFTVHTLYDGFTDETEVLYA